MKTVVLLFLSMAAAFGQVVPGRYVVQLAGDPAAVGAPKAELAARRAGVRQRQMNARQAIADLGGTVIESMDTVFNGLIVNIPDARVAELSNMPGVVKVHKVYRLRPFLNHALPIHKVPDAWLMLPQGQNSAGAGIKIGMIDSGIDVTNPGFSDSLPPVAGFPMVLTASDQKFTNAKIIVAKNYTFLLSGPDPDADDRDGHGSGTSMAAAGGSAISPFGTLSGVAPKAYLGNYKVVGARCKPPVDISGCPTSDVIAKAIDDAVADGMDVLNISLGLPFVTDFEEVDPSSLDLAVIEAATQAGVVVAVAAGNEGPGPTTVSDIGSVTDAISVGAIENDRTLEDSVTPAGGAPFLAVPGNGADPRTVLSGSLFDVTQLDSTSLACSPLAPGSVTGMIVLILRGTCTFEDKMNHAAAGGAVAAVIYNNGTTQPFGFGFQDVRAATLPTLFMSQADGQALLAQLGANPGLPVSLDFTISSQFPIRTDLAVFSSRGPNLAAALKPDLVAVGDNIVTAAQYTYPDGGSYDPSGFIDTGGTSFSSPLVAGSAAVLKAARPGLTVQQYRSLLINSAGPATASPTASATIQQAGAGVLNLAAALSSTITAYPTSLNFGTGAGTINNTLNLTLANAGTASDTLSISLVPTGNSPAPALSANSIQLDPGASQQISATVNVSNLTPGEYQGYVQVSSTVNSSVANIPYWFAVPGSDPAGISTLYQDFVDPAGSNSSGAVVFRVVDVAGLPFTGSLQPTVTVAAGGGRVRRVYPGGDIPGTYAVDIRLGSATLQLTIQIGNVSQDVFIGVF
jgi:minor extracellular serine protease Vpr